MYNTFHKFPLLPHFDSLFAGVRALVCMTEPIVSCDLRNVLYILVLWVIRSDFLKPHFASIPHER